jgi:hypothetical protein
VLLDEVCEVQRAGQSPRPRADNQYIRFQFFPFDRHAVILSEVVISISKIVPAKFPIAAGS